MAGFYWVVDSALTSLMFGEGNLLRQVFQPAHHDLWTRLIVVCLLLIFGASFQYTLGQLRQAQNQVRKLSRVVDQSPAMVMITDTAGNIEYVNPRFTEVTGYHLGEVLGRNPRLLKSGETPDREYRELWGTIACGGEWRGELLNRKKSGERFWESVSISPIRNVDGRITHFIAMGEDVTRRKMAEEELVHAATHDALTGLFNRRYFTERLEGAFRSARRYGYPLSLCLCDLDLFKEINDTHGHDVGDQVLAGFGALLRSALRSEDIAGRYGGDEFIMVFPHVTAEEAAVGLQRIRRRLETERFGAPQGKSVAVAASFGVAQMAPVHADARALVEAADAALYRAKQAGRNRIGMPDAVLPPAQEP
jgi:diguanylate cyclase (GGDEF)-like protein/PAS domain S-box-containing protein